MTVAIRVLALSLVAVGVGLAAGSLDVNAPPRVLNSPLDLGWTLADFDGDLHLDFASARPAHPVGREYAHEVLVSFGVSETSFSFRSRTARIELSARDIDGDADCDIIVREAGSKQPIGVWLNDGDGSFEEGDLSEFQKSLGSDSGPSVCAKWDREALAALLIPRVQAAPPSVSPPARDLWAEFRVARPDSALGLVRSSNIRSRAPPLS